MPTPLVRPTVLDTERRNLILGLLKCGNRLSVALKAADISRRAFNYWENKFRRGDALPEDIRTFFEELPKAEAFAENAALAQVLGGSPDWRGSAWFLERRFPQRWGRRDRPPLALPSKDLDKMTDEELAAYEAELAKAKG